MQLVSDDEIFRGGLAEYIFIDSARNWCAVIAYTVNCTLKLGCP